MDGSPDTRAAKPKPRKAQTAKKGKGVKDGKHLVSARLLVVDLWITVFCNA